MLAEEQIFLVGAVSADTNVVGFFAVPMMTQTIVGMSVEVITNRIAL